MRSNATNLQLAKLAAMFNQLDIIRQDIAIGLHRLRHGGAYVRDGLEITVPREVKRGIKHQLVSGDYEREEFALATDWVSPDHPVIELGGCLGVVSAHLRRLLRPDVELITVEANPKLIDACRANATRPAPSAPTRIVCAAVAYGCQTVAFHLNRNSHVSRLASDGLEANHESSAVTLAKLVADLGASGDYTLICDIEGGEYDLFELDRTALERCRLAIVETHPHLRDDPDEARAYFQGLANEAGFEIAAADGDVLVLKRNAASRTPAT